MPTLHLITTGGPTSPAHILAEAAKKRGVETQELNPTQPFDLTAQPSQAGAWYRHNHGQTAMLIGRHLSMHGLKSIHRTNDSFSLATNKFSQIAALAAAGIPMAQTIVSGKNDAASLRHVGDTLGFPLLIKGNTGHRGAGIMLVDSPSALMSLVSYLEHTNAQFVFQKYLPNTNGKTIRVIVLDDQIITAYSYGDAAKDFRSSAVRGLDLVPYDLPEAVQAIALLAARTVGLAFAGIDILHSDGTYYVSEVNAAPSFARVDRELGVDIAGSLVEYLTSVSPA